MMEAVRKGKADAAFVYYYMAQAFVNSDTTGTMTYTLLEQLHSPTAWEICRWHHERWDGKGYPDGLKGEETPISAQVVSIVDVYDALTSERCYKKAFDHDTAIQMILDGQCGRLIPSDAIQTGMPLVERVATVTGEKIRILKLRYQDRYKRKS